MGTGAYLGLRSQNRPYGRYCVAIIPNPVLLVPLVAVPTTPVRATWDVQKQSAQGKLEIRHLIT